MLLDRLLSRCSDHLSLFAAPGTLDRAYDPEPEACETVLGIVRENVPWIAVDVPHLWTAWAKQVVLRADRVVLIAMPDLANLRNAKNLVDQLKASRPNDRPPLLVLNQVGIPKRPEIPSRISATRSSSSQRPSSISIRSSSAPPPITARWSRRWPATRRLPSSSARSPACLPTGPSRRPSPSPCLAPSWRQHWLRSRMGVA